MWVHRAAWGSKDDAGACKPADRRCHSHRFLGTQLTEVERGLLKRTSPLSQVTLYFPHETTRPTLRSLSNTQVLYQIDSSEGGTFLIIPCCPQQQRGAARLAWLSG